MTITDDPITFIQTYEGYSDGQRIEYLMRDLTQRTTRLNEVVEQHNERLAELHRLERRLAEAQQFHRDDVATIGARLIAEARRRDWCSDYDNVVDSLNRDLHVGLPKRYVTYRIERTFSVTVTTTEQGYVGDEDDLNDQSTGAISPSDLRHFIDNGWAVMDNDGEPENVSVEALGGEE